MTKFHNFYSESLVLYSFASHHMTPNCDLLHDMEESLQKTTDLENFSKLYATHEGKLGIVSKPAEPSQNHSNVFLYNVLYV